MKQRVGDAAVDRDRDSATLRLAALVCAVILGLAALALAKSVMTPVAFALFIVALVWPLQRRLRRHLPQLVAVLTTAAVALIAVFTVGWLRRTPEPALVTEPEPGLQATV